MSRTFFSVSRLDFVSRSYITMSSIEVSTFWIPSNICRILLQYISDAEIFQMVIFTFWCIECALLHPIATRILLNSPTLKIYLLLSYLLLLPHVLGVKNALGGLFCSGFADPYRTLAFRLVCATYVLHLPVLLVELLC